MDAARFVSKTLQLISICLILIMLSGCSHGRNIPFEQKQKPTTSEEASAMFEKETKIDKILHVATKDPEDDKVTAFLQAAKGTNVFLATPVAQMERNGTWTPMLVQQPKDKDGNISYAVAILDTGSNEPTLHAIYECPLVMLIENEPGKWCDNPVVAAGAEDVKRAIEEVSSERDNGSYEALTCLAIKVDSSTCYCILCRSASTSEDEPDRYSLFVVEESINGKYRLIESDDFRLAG